MLLTSDSINLILIDGKFRMSLNQSITTPISNDVVGDMRPGIDESLQKLDETAALILRRIIEHELVISEVAPEK